MIDFPAIGRPVQQTSPRSPRARRRLSWLAALTVAVLLLPASGAAANPSATAYTQRLEAIELRLRLAIETDPAELAQNVTFTEILCQTAQTAEAAGEAPAARVDWAGLAHIVHHADLNMVGTIEGTLGGADRRTRDLGRIFAGTWRDDPAATRRLGTGVGKVRAGIFRVLAALGGYRQAFHRFLGHDCRGGELGLAAAALPIQRGLARIDSGMGLLWLLAEQVKGG